MSQHHLKPLFAPKSVAVFGASDRIDSVGQIVFQNILQSGYQGALYPINPTHAEIQGERDGIKGTIICISYLVKDLIQGTYVSKSWALFATCHQPIWMRLKVCCCECLKWYVNCP
jgi:hypothetical protein